MPFGGLLTLGIIGAVGGIGAAAIGSSAAGNAADTQSQAAVQAAQIQAQSAQNALDFNKQQWATNQNNMQPWLQAGTGAVNQLSALMAPGGSLTQQWGQQFQAPSAQQAEATPGYQFTLGQGLQALDRGAAARGNLLTGGTMQAEQQYGQGLASQTYQQTFNNTLTQYQQAYNQFQQGQANTYNRLAGLAGTGQTAAQTLGQQGQSAANTNANINLTSGQQQGNALQNAAAATASGYVGAGNAWSGALGNTASSLSNAFLLNNLMNSGGSNISNTVGAGDLNPNVGIQSGTPPSWVTAIP